MRPVTSRLEVVVGTTPTVNVSPVYAVGIPPSDIDSVWDKIRVDVGGRIILRDYDPGEDIDTGAPVPYTTVGGDTLVTMDGRRYVTVVQA